MSSSNSSPNASQRPGQTPSSHTTSTYPYLRHPASQQSNGSKSSMNRPVAYNASITSNPSQVTQITDEEPDFWLGNPKYNAPAVSSPGSMHAAGDIYGVDGDTSHHESSFDDFLTTEASSENPLSEHTTPQELIWEQQFIPQEALQPHILGAYSPREFELDQGASATSELQQILQQTGGTLPKYISGQDLLTSRGSSTGSSLSLPTHSYTIDQKQPAAMDLDPGHHKRTISQSLKVDTAPNHPPSLGHKIGVQQHTAQMRASSPVVMVSDYESSRNPVQNIVPNSAKRSRGSSSSDDDDDDDDANGITLISSSRKNSTSWLMPPGAAGVQSRDPASPKRAGVAPHARDDEIVDSFKDTADKRQLEERNDHVQEWLATSDAGSNSSDQGHKTISRRMTQTSKGQAYTEAQNDELGRVYSDAHIPGPGVLVDVESDDEYFADSDIEEHTEQVVQDYTAGSPRLSPRALEFREEPDHTAFPTLELDDPTAAEEPLRTQFIRRGPWQDPDFGPIATTQSQPHTSKDAAYKFNQEAAKWETSSRAATWGTRRRLSESEVNSIVDGSQIRQLSVSQRGRERTGSFLNRARGIFPRKSSSNIKEDQVAEAKEPSALGHAHRSSVGSIKPAQRVSSWGKSKSPSVSTGSALIAMTGQLAAIGRGNSVTHEVDNAKSSRPVQALKKQRSRSDVSKNIKGAGGLADLLTRHGGPPVPTLASPMHEREPILAAQIIDNEDGPADEEDDDLDEVAIKMDLEVRAEDIVTTTEGFRDHARKLNPRIQPYLLDRVAHEQIRRYKKLVETKIKHMRTVQIHRKCSSGSFCFELGGEAKLLAPRVSSKDPDTTLTQFQVNNSMEEEVDESGFTDGVVTPALFPAGIPLPPVQKLPAEFECNLCFKVKKFQKPSDWTKHVHEDIQPFSCSFPNCTESKSFKRKADWVRHENERHRHLEWWKCSVQDCNHVCHRKDNFVQHLVREHKMTEPKVKRGSSSSKNKAVNNGVSEDSEVWRLVEDCRSQSESKPRDEPCPFCGNVCSTFKKLSVHMGKHMEQIAMPILQLVNLRQVSPDTIISPIEQAQKVPSTFGTVPVGTNPVDTSNLSPYPMSATSAYQTSSAGQSPASMYGRVQNGAYQFDRGFYSPHAMTPITQGTFIANGHGAAGNYLHQSPTFVPSVQTAQSHNHILSPHAALVTPQSQLVHPGYDDTLFEPSRMMYSQAPVQNIYMDTQSRSPAMTGYGTGQYAVGQTHIKQVHSSPNNLENRTGLQVQRPMDHHLQDQYLYGASGNGFLQQNMY